VGIVLFCDPIVCVATLLGDDAHRHALYGVRRAVGMTEQLG
jgi:hypothetical protein